ncbi:unnamed protein product [Clonostachys chloroleuca]|uniref:Phosphoribulokinase/uridine kinase domain-containing protein n=1 Tax=Clonostachys chloroleuca TaxID=1926264 RepID=A0AA35Q0Q2_9HYPO|nr:unnamed protein product [Clonostachys chloroleuca]
MEAQVERLVDKAWKMYEQTPSDKRLLIGVAGIPGSGKTTLAAIVSSRLQDRARQAGANGQVSIALSMDGFHKTREELSAMPDPDTAHARRGAAFTFNAEKFLDLVTSLRDSIGAPVLAPTFDHALKDPREADIVIQEVTRIVIVEGLYVALDEPVWRDAAKLLDDIWFVNVDFEVARKRLRERHVRAGIVKDLEEGDRRALENDLVNGKEIVEKKLSVSEIIQSRDDGSWVHE